MDIVERLRICAKYDPDQAEAADEIERLREALRFISNINYGNGREVKGTKQYMKFWSEHASYPFKSHDAWFVTEDIRWGQFEASTDVKAMVNKVNREDLWRDAAKALGVAAADIPASSSRGKDTFFDGKVFDPENPQAYLKSLSIKRIEV